MSGALQKPEASLIGQESTRKEEVVAKRYRTRGE